MEKFVHKLSTARGQEHSRIWLERERLTRAGFTKGKTFRKTWAGGALTLTLAKPGKDDAARDFGTVAGTDDRPVIDIVGEKVREYFGSKATHISVTYEEGSITVRVASAFKQ